MLSKIKIQANSATATNKDSKVTKEQSTESKDQNSKKEQKTGNEEKNEERNNENNGMNVVKNDYDEESKEQNTESEKPYVCVACLGMLQDQLCSEQFLQQVIDDISLHVCK